MRGLGDEIAKLFHHSSVLLPVTLATVFELAVAFSPRLVYGCIECQWCTLGFATQLHTRNKLQCKLKDDPRAGERKKKNIPGKHPAALSACCRGVYQEFHQK